ncbi:hypothetical protein LWI29_014531 [Acer saccharum]|uniref:C-JID domain-containing protein n=1 Tax=Acer saccharum TaxID=4024 RepID=A0AA39SVA9_ACESA|nr:hypothetical protein LWI29_014531 [Acer saccharum]
MGIIDEAVIYDYDIRSNIVLVDSRVKIFRRELLYYDNEITFQFYIPHDMKQHKVEKCGVHLMFAQHRKEVNGSSRIGEDEDVLSLEKVDDNCEEEDEHIKDDKAAVVDAFICYPGSEIPEWFKFRSNESFINVELPPDWFDYNYAGFVLSVVVAPCLDHQDDEVEYWRIEWNCNLKSEDGDPCVRTGLFYVDINEEQDIRSNHVFVYSCVNISPSELLFCDNEITFQFYIRHDMKQQYKVEKCGVHLIFAQHREEVNGSSRIREDEDVLSLANVHDNCEEEDELIKITQARHLLGQRHHSGGFFHARQARFAARNMVVGHRPRFGPDRAPSATVVSIHVEIDCRSSLTIGLAVDHRSSSSDPHVVGRLEVI